MHPLLHFLHYTAKEEGMDFSVLVSQMTASQAEVSLPKGKAAGPTVQGSTLTLPKHTPLPTPSLWEMEERAPYRVRAVCSRQDAQQVLIKCCTWYSSKHNWLPPRWQVLSFRTFGKVKRKVQCKHPVSHRWGTNALREVTGY